MYKNDFLNMRIKVGLISVRLRLYNININIYN